jgi:hypothetical protein
MMPKKKLCQVALPIVSQDVWENGTTITFHKIPLPFRRKPVISSNVPSKTELVPLDRVFASQRTATDIGLCKPIKGLPFAYREHDGTFTVGDGHHRIVQALLRGRKRLKMRVVTVP